MYSDPSEAKSPLQLRISLRGVSPLVRRRLLIPERITVAQLHHVTQLAMGWTDAHVHQFIIRGWRYGGHRDGAFQFFDGPDTLSLAEFGLHDHERFAYVHDVTAWWLHDVRVERRTNNQRSKTAPRCIAGAGRAARRRRRSREICTSFSSGSRRYAKTGYHPSALRVMRAR
ncbi:plasmid pRiA4b ORF-3 family protein [Paraburkholderia hospita]|uniref:plasmid pRiA4b ORF-3 family protein n=1 Tax=Paraburkholderia hospita TaxID=169430 RepID=UPI000685EE83